jgi:hypothetical protein
MSIFKPNLFESFEIKGEWWFPWTPNKKVPGTLLFEGGRQITLEILGSLHGRDAMWDNQREYPASILGLSNNGDEFTLFQNAELHKSSSSKGGAGSTKYQSFYVFWGAHLSTVEGTMFASSTVNYSFLEEWAWKRPFQTEFKKENPRARTVSYDLHISFELTIPSINSTLRLWHGLSSGGLDDHYRKMVLEHAAHMDLEPNEARDFEWHKSHIYKLRNFLTLCVGRPIHMKEVVLTLAGQGPSQEGQRKIPDQIIHLYFTQTQEANELDINSRDLILTMRDIDEPELASMLDHWFLTADALETVHQLYFGSLRRKGMYDHLRFLSLTQALETYHRVTREGEYLPVEEYSRILAVLIPAIPKDVPIDLKESLKSRLKYGNEHSLRKRINSLVDELSENCISLVTKDRQSFVSRIIDTRNYLTHYSDELKAGALTGAELYNSIRRLRILIMILLFKETGLDEAKISDMLGKNEDIVFGWVTDIEFDTGGGKKAIEAASSSTETDEAEE